MRCKQVHVPLQSLGVLIYILLLLSGCSSENNRQLQFEKLPSSQTGLNFQNVVEENVDLNVVTNEMIYNGAGVAAGDIDNDGLADLFFASNMGTSKLYKNQGEFSFSDITEESGIDTAGKWAVGVTMVDINADGFMDIYISYGGPYAAPNRRSNELYVNNGDLTFTEKAAEYGIDDTGFTTHAVFFDYNMDNLLDLYLLTNGQGEVPPNVIRPKQTEGEHVNTDRLYRNNGNGTFTNVSEEAGILIEGYGLGVNMLDINLDGLPDIHAANDFLPNDVVYINNGDGTFTDQASTYFRHQSYSSMGTDFGDINNDGYMDIIVVDMLPESDSRVKQMYQTIGYQRFISELNSGYDPQVKRNVLQLHTGLTADGIPAYSEIGLFAGIENTDWSWSALFADFDNDKFSDLLITNGLPRNPADSDFSEIKMNLLRGSSFDRSTKEQLFQELLKLEGSHEPNYLFRNNGNLTFSDVSKDWGFSDPGYSTGAIYVDLNNDGSLDIVINNTNEEAFVYRNRADTTDANYLQIKLQGPGKNLQAIGSKVVVYADGSELHHHYSVSRGYLSSMATPIHFGLGEISKVDSVVVTWPDRTMQSIMNIPVNSLTEISYTNRNSSVPDQRRTVSDPKIFQDVTEKKGVNFEHLEEDFIDFRIQPLLPHKFSKLGPGLAVADVNQDGLEDFFVGGAFEQSGEIFIQKMDGTFSSKELDGGNNYEKDMGALFVDLNGDSFKDLYVSSGGSEFRTGSEYYQDRVYFGDGDGGFTLQKDVLPPIYTSSSVVAAADFDRDGTQDIFVGGRILPNQYPNPPQSYILTYQEGRFVNITDAVAPQMKEIGLVSGATWSDFNNDKWPDLIVTGEWMPITVFENREGRLENVTDELGLSETVGWWNSIIAGDFNQDGYIDYVAGNLGLNSTVQNTENGNVQITFGDFNRDGLTDPVISQMLNGIRKPVHLRDDMLMQMPVLESRYPTYKSYGEAALSDVLSSEHLASDKNYTVDTFETTVFINEEGESFRVETLPAEAQFAPVFGLQAGDFDADGFPDILMTGNSFSTETFTGWYDAFSGLFLKGNGDGNFEAVPFSKSGFYFPGDAKSLASLTGVNDEKLILAARNNGKLEIFEANQSKEQIALRLQPDDRTVEIKYINGRVEKREFYEGGGFLSQKSRILFVGKNVEQLTICNESGNCRTRTP
ncbi:VCBS repeat-containing protein [Rhodohalobacter sulfatireducens]|uniref:VCBS repeat-containing protein n=1 Tax=Rhodohalobacter sulfatireducens TaxID=2911366 RepID=A0ABS9KH49_9BACT|nr:VCBS repeat-containing protein [Rhodohalobacter sulfatireducens]MCG2590150.1 VCBS repeat-containing protein [Rhodohalobacter sulfatireducens]